MLTYEDLIKDYRISRNTIHRWLEIATETDRCLLYQNHMLDSSGVGSCDLVVTGPGRTINPDDPPKRYGSVPSQFKEFEGEVDIETMREGVKDFEPIGLQKFIRIAGGDEEVGRSLLSIYEFGDPMWPSPKVRDLAKKLHLAYYRNKSTLWQGRGWFLTKECWRRLEE